MSVDIMPNPQQQVLTTPYFLRCAIVTGLFVALTLACETPSNPYAWIDEPLPDPQVPSQPAMPPPSSDTLRIHMDGLPGSLNPLDRPSVWSLRITMDTVFETLIRYPQSGPYQPGLAQSWTTSADGMSLHFKLHEKAVFQDGQPVTAADVEFSIVAARAEENLAEHHREALKDVTTIDSSSPQQITIQLARPNGFVLRQLALLPILPKHVYGTRVAQQDELWVGSGPYKIASVDADGVLLKSNLRYWGDSPDIKTIHFTAHPDAAAVLRDAIAGQVDIIPQLIPEHFPGQLQTPSIERQFVALTLRPPTVSYLILNTAKPPFDDIRVRVAVAHLLGAQSLSQNQTRNVTGPVWPGGPGHGSKLPVPRFHKETAFRLLDQAGWRDDNGDGNRTRGGKRLAVIALTTGHPLATQIGTILRDAGFAVHFREGHSAVLHKRLRYGEFSLAFAHWSGDGDRNLAPLFASTGRENYGKFANRQIDELLRNVELATTSELRTQRAGELAEQLLEQMPIIPLSAPDPHGLVHKRIGGLRVWNGWFAIRDLRRIDPAIGQ